METSEMSKVELLALLWLLAKNIRENAKTADDAANIIDDLIGFLSKK